MGSMYGDITTCASKWWSMISFPCRLDFLLNVVWKERRGCFENHSMESGILIVSLLTAERLSWYVSRALHSTIHFMCSRVGYETLQGPVPFCRKSRNAQGSKCGSLNLLLPFNLWSLIRRVHHENSLSRHCVVMRMLLVLRTHQNNMMFTEIWRWSLMMPPHNLKRAPMKLTSMFHLWS